MNIDESLVTIDNLYTYVQNRTSLKGVTFEEISPILESIHDVFVYFEKEMPIDSVDKQMCYSDICRRVENLYVSHKKGQYENILSDICILLDKLRHSIGYYLM